MKKVLSLLTVLALIVAVFVSCSEKGQVSEVEKESVDDTQKKLKIVTTIYPQYDFAKNIAGDKADVKMLLKAGTETHSYEPSPKDIEEIKNSDIFIYVGSENDHWVDRIFESFDGEKPDCIKLIECVDGVIAEHNDDEHRNDEHNHKVDEHVWTSPKNAIKIVTTIKDMMVAKDKKNAPIFEENAINYIKELENLDKSYQELIGKSKRKTIIFADRFPFVHLAKEYGLRYYSPFSGCSTETEVDAKSMAVLEKKIREEKLPVVFTIEMNNGKMADAICEDTGAKKMMLHSCHNLTKDEIEAGEDYLSIMKSNLKKLEEALN